MNRHASSGWLLVIAGALTILLISQTLVIQAASVVNPDQVGHGRPVEADLLSPGYSQSVLSGSHVTFTHVLTNVSAVADSFVLTATSAQGWPVELYGPTEALTLPVQLEAGFTATVLLQIDVPSGIVSGTIDTAIITATSQTTPTLTDESVNTIIVQNPTWIVDLPLVFRAWPPVPDIPVLNSINNAGASSYIVSWNPADRAITYTLQESTEAGFANPTVRYVGLNTQWGAVNQLTGGTYAYRVKATNAWGDSAWSNVQSAYVPSPAAAGIHGRVTYLGVPVSGHQVTLRLCNRLTALSWSCPSGQNPSVSTQLDGSYQFTTAASLGANQKYYVSFYNYPSGNYPSGNPNYLMAAGGPDIYSYTAGQTMSGGTFDVANVPLLEPANAITTGVPLVFRWTPRAIGPLDSYQLSLWNASDESIYFYSPLLGHVGSYTLTSLPANFTPGKYAWSVSFHSSAGRGTSFETRLVTFPGTSRK